MNAARVSRLPAALLACASALSAPAWGADVVVNTGSDGNFVPVGACKLRDALQAANTDAAVGNCAAGSGSDRIVFDGVTNVTLLAEGLEVTESLTIDGGGTLVRIRRNPADVDRFRILDVTDENATLTLRWIAIESGSLVAELPSNGSGAGIRSAGRVILEDSRVADNHAHATSGDGGGIHAGEVQLLRSEVSDNGAGSLGAGIFAATATLVDAHVHGNVATDTSGIGGGLHATGSVSVSGSTISNNRAHQGGGGIYSPIVTVRNSTLSGNEAELCGGALAGHVISIQNSTVTNNAAGDNASGGVCALASDDIAHSLGISNSIVWGNLGDIGTLQDPVDAAGVNNIIGPVGGSVSLPSDTVDCDPGLAPLADNGGWTPTHAIADDSCARDTATNPFNLPTDQRGEARTAGSATDIGAYELQSATVFSDGFEP